jgi:S1-C subfamily serine protease
MFKNFFWIFITSGIIIVLIILSQLFVIPYIINNSFFEKYHLNDSINKKTVVINKTEKVIVKENFSLAKTSERVSPSVVKILFFQSNKVKKTKINLNQSSKTGVVLSSDGVIVTTLTNNLLAFEKDNFRVILDNGEIFQVEKIIQDKFNNLLFLKIKADNLAVPPFGNSQELEDGEKVILVGRSRSTEKPVFSLSLIQEHNLNFNKEGRKFLFSDENSSVFILAGGLKEEFKGGPVVDFNGTMVGLVDSIENVDGVHNFFVPITNIAKSLDKIITNNKVQYPKLGVYYFKITPELAYLNNLSDTKGAFVYAPSGVVTLTNSAGRKAGLVYGDIIQAVNDETVDMQKPFSMLLSKYNSEDRIILKVLRKSKKIEIPVILK